MSDATFDSLLSLLSSPHPSAISHLSLLPPQTLHTSLVYYLGQKSTRTILLQALLASSSLAALPALSPLLFSAAKTAKITSLPSAEPSLVSLSLLSGALAAADTHRNTRRVAPAWGTHIDALVEQELGQEQKDAVAQLLANLAPQLQEDLLTPRSNAVTSLMEDVITRALPEVLLVKGEQDLLKHLSAYRSQAPFIHLGPISNLLSTIYAAQARSLSPEETYAHVSPLLSLFLGRAEAWSREWEDQALDEASRTEVFIYFKSLLFSALLVHDSLLDGLLDAIPAQPLVLPLTAAAPSTTPKQEYPEGLTTSNLPLPYLQLSQTVLRTHAALSWLEVSTQALDRVLFAALDLVARDGVAALDLTEMLWPGHLATPAASAAGKEREMSSKEKDQEKRHLGLLTFYFDAVEQLLPSLPPATQRQLLGQAEPYLHTPVWKQTYEAAHSVFLATFASHSQLCAEVAPHYATVLLQAFDAHISKEQFELGYVTLVEAASASSDALALYLCDELRSAIEQEEEAASRGSAADGSSPAGGDEPASEPAMSVTPRLQALRSTHIALLPALHLVLLHTHLAHIRVHILDSPPTKELREALAEKTFEALGKLDAATRDAGAMWWTREREAFGV